MEPSENKVVERETPTKRAHASSTIWFNLLSFLGVIAPVALAQFSLIEPLMSAESAAKVLFGLYMLNASVNFGLRFKTNNGIKL
jgi:hypothetical protein